MKLSKLIEKLQDFMARCQNQPKPADPEVHFTIEGYNRPFAWYGLNNPYTFEPLWIIQLETVKRKKKKRTNQRRRTNNVFFP